MLSQVASFLIATMLLAPALQASEPAVQKARKGYPDRVPKTPNGRCFLSIDGKTKVNGPCVIEGPEKDGSFYFDDNRMVQWCAYKGTSCIEADYAVTRDGVFGYLNTNAKAPADLKWNEGNLSHAQAYLGPVARAGIAGLAVRADFPTLDCARGRPKKSARCRLACC